MEGGSTWAALRSDAMRRDRAMIAWLAFGLAMVTLVSKAILLPFDVVSAEQFVRWCLRLGIVVAADMAFVLALASCSVIGVFACCRWQRAAQVWRVVVLLAFEVAGVYAVASVKIFQVTTEMLSVRLLTFAGSPGLMLSSLTNYLTIPVVLALLAVLLLPLGLRDQWRASRGVSPAPWRPWAAAIVFVAIYCSAAQAYMAGHWNQVNRWERKIAQNPHTVFLVSCLEEFASSDGLFDNTANQPDESDFVAPQLPPPPLSLAPGTLRPRNVVLIVMESVASEYVRMFGGKYDTTPQLERLAAENGVVFENLYVQCPYSCNSLVSLAASIYPRCDGKVIARDNPEIRVPLINEDLARHGYRSCYLHSGYWSWKHRDKLFGRDRQASRTTLIDAETLPGPAVNSWGVADRNMYAAALDWIDQERDQPFFLMAFTIETHHPYVIPDDSIDFHQEPSLNRYLNALRKADASIAWVVQQLRNRGLLDSTLVVVTSDHGESFGQHGQWVHGFGVHQPQVVVPLVLLHPSLRDMPRRVSEVRQQIDIAPTLLHVLGYEPPSDWQGRSLLGRPDDARAYFFSLGVRFNFGLRDGNYKYHYRINSGVDELFDLSRDPDELTDLAANHPELCRQYRRKLAGWASYQHRFLEERGVK